MRKMVGVQQFEEHRMQTVTDKWTAMQIELDKRAAKIGAAVGVIALLVAIPSGQPANKSALFLRELEPFKTRKHRQADLSHLR